MSLIKQKCHLSLPYAGAFLKKNDKYSPPPPSPLSLFSPSVCLIISFTIYVFFYKNNYYYFYDSNESEVVTSLDDIYNIGTFVQIMDCKPYGNGLQLIMKGHRRLVMYVVCYLIIAINCASINYYEFYK